MTVLGDLISLGASGPAKLWLTYRYQRCRRRAKRPRVHTPPATLACSSPLYDDSHRMATATLVAADATTVAAAAVAAASRATATSSTRALKYAALAQLRCPPCGRPFASACVLPCGHAIDEACLLNHAVSLAKNAAFDCPMCEALINRPPTRSPHLDAAVDVLLNDDKDARQQRSLRLQEALQTREATRERHADLDSKVGCVIRELLFGCEGALPSQLDAEPLVADCEGHYGKLFCEGCGEFGHLQAACPHRSDISDTDDEED